MSQLQTDSLPQMRDVEKILFQCDKLKKMVEKHEQTIKQAALRLASNLGEDQKLTKDNMDNFEKSFLSTIALEDAIQQYTANANHLKQFVDRALNRQQQQQNIGLGENLADKFLKDDYKKPLDTEKYKTSLKYRDLKREVHAVHNTTPLEGLNDEDDDLVVASQTISITCPISLTTLTEPVKSSACNHVFSKAAIIGIFKNLQQMQCPVAGCGRIITKNQLQRSIETEELVKRELRKKERDDQLRRDNEDITEV